MNVNSNNDRLEQFFYSARIFKYILQRTNRDFVDLVQVNAQFGKEGLLFIIKTAQARLSASIYWIDNTVVPEGMQESFDVIKMTFEGASLLLEEMLLNINLQKEKELQNNLLQAMAIAKETYEHIKVFEFLNNTTKG